MSDALVLRTDLAAKVSMGTETPESAISRLRMQPAASGLPIDADADFGYAAIDVGQRLITLRKPAAAESFFKAAEQSLDVLIRRTADNQPRDKAQYLRKIALIRGEYLNKAGQAKLDIEQALVLQPDDKDLARAKQILANSHAPLPLMNPRG